MKRFKAIIHASEILTGAGIRMKDGRGINDEDLGRIRDGALVYSTKKAGTKEIPDRVEWVGPSASLPKKWARLRKTDLKLQKAVVPGFVDCHNHLIFAGDRSDEFAMRCGGASYQTIAAK